jgi:hypothetical protein
MTWHILTLDNAPHFETLRDCPSGNVLILDRLYDQVRLAELDLVFNDAIVASDGSPLAIEFHVDHQHPFYRTINQDHALDLFDYVDHTPFPCIWFSHRRDGKQMGFEAFGNLRLFRRDDGVHAIAFNWS